MSYIDSVDFQKDFNNLVKSLLLISKRLEEVTNEISLIKELLPQPIEESTTD